jgi:hypothetical protein
MSVPVTAQAKHTLLAGLGMVALMFGGYKTYLLIHPSFVPSAGLQIYYYTGPGPFNVTQCITQTGRPSPPCIGIGSVTASFTLNGVPAGTTGTVTASQVSSWGMSSNGIPGFRSEAQRV